MKTLEELKQELDDARAPWEAAEAARAAATTDWNAAYAWAVAWDAYTAALVAYKKKQELTDEDT